MRKKRNAPSSYILANYTPILKGTASNETGILN
jgi:hypothetical protein